MIKLMDLLREGIEENKDLQELANQVIEFFADKNKNKIQLWRNNGFTERNIDFNEDLMSTEDFDTSKLQMLGDFVTKSKLSVMIDNSITPNGYYNNNGKVYISTKNLDLKDSVQYLMQFDHEDKKLLKLALGTSCRRTLVHEFQHAYDDYRSKGKYRSDKESVSYYKNIKIVPKNRAEYDLYLQLPHEYWARLAPILSDLPLNKGLEDVIYDMEAGINGWELLDKKAQRRLIRAVSNYYYKNK